MLEMKALDVVLTKAWNTLLRTGTKGICYDAKITWGACRVLWGSSWLYYWVRVVVTAWGVVVLWRMLPSACTWLMTWHSMCTQLFSWCFV